MMQATERFEAVYPTLKEVALAGSPGSKAMKQVSQQIMTVSLKASGEGTFFKVDKKNFNLKRLFRDGNFVPFTYECVNLCLISSR